MPGPLSIIVPTKNRLESLRRLLESIVRAGGGDRPEVVVVNDGGRSAKEIVGDYESKLAVRYLEAEPGGPAAARNAGSATATGTHLAFLDDDCELSGEWLAAMQRAVDKDPRSMLGGVTVNVAPGPFASTSQLLVEHLYDYYTASGSSSPFVASNNMIVPRERFLEVGGFDARFPRAAAEDRDLCDRWIAAGWPIALVPDALVLHGHALTLYEFLAQHFGYGRGAYLFHKCRRERGSFEFRVEPPRFYMEMLKRAARGRRPGDAALHVGLMIATQTANAAGFFKELMADKLARRSPRE